MVKVTRKRFAYVMFWCMTLVVLVMLGRGVVALWPFIDLLVHGVGVRADQMPEYEAAAKTGEELRGAILRYKYDVGLWPLELKVLVPEYIDEVPEGWQYYWGAGPSGPELWMNGWQGVYIEYDKDRCVWTARSRDGDPVTLSVRGVSVQLPPIDEDVLWRRTLAELDRRIAGERKYLTHYQGKVSLLIRRGEWVAARLACEDAARAFPARRWPWMMLAKFELDDGMRDEALALMAEWVVSTNSYDSYVGYAWFLRCLCEHERALDVLGEMCRRWRANDFMHGDLDAWECYDTVNFCYENEAFEDALVACDMWKAAVSYDNTAYASEAMVLLAMGRVREAREELARVLAGGEYRGWLDDFELLEAAIKSGDTAYRHKVETERDDLDGLLVEYN